MSTQITTEDKARWTSPSDTSMLALTEITGVVKRAGDPEDGHHWVYRIWDQDDEPITESVAGPGDGWDQESAARACHEHMTFIKETGVRYQP